MNLAIFHLLEKKEEYKNEVNACRRIIYAVLNKKPFLDELKKLTKHFWLICNEKENGFEALPEAEQIDEESLQFAALKLTIAIELMKYEKTYESVNYSTAIGQLATASWILQGKNEEFGQRCRDIYHSIENKNLSINDVEKLRYSVINTIKILHNDVYK